MNTETASVQSVSRGWFVVGGVSSLILGAMAIAIPCVTTVAIAKMVGLLSLVSGAVLLGTGLFGKARKHRILDIATGILRIILGLIFIGNLLTTVAVLTLFLAGMFVAEGVMGVFLALSLRGKNPAWGWVLFNSLGAFVLGLLLFIRFPSDAPWAIGMLFGINSLFIGMSLIMYGLGLKQAREA